MSGGRWAERQALDKRTAAATSLWTPPCQSRQRRLCLSVHLGVRCFLCHFFQQVPSLRRVDSLEHFDDAQQAPALGTFYFGFQLLQQVRDPLLRLFGGLV